MSQLKVMTQCPIILFTQETRVRNDNLKCLQSNAWWWWWWLSSQVKSNSCDPMDCSPPGSSVHGILQARIMEWVAMPSSRGLSRPRDQTQVSRTAERFFTDEPPEKPSGMQLYPHLFPLILLYISL